MFSRTHVPLAGLLVVAFALPALAQSPLPTTPRTAEQQVQALVQSGAHALEIGDGPQARAAYNELLAIGRKTSRVDLEWQAQHGLGRAALSAHDPLTAIDHLEHAVAAYERSRAAFPAESAPGDAAARRDGPYHTLVTALMMQSSSPGDQFVERAFGAATRARTARPDSARSRAELAAALGPGDVVIAYLVGESDAYAWAFDRNALIGYPLPPSTAIATAVERINAYLAQRDRAGVQRIAEDLMPALLGPVLDRVPALTRVMMVTDGALRQLAIGELPLGDGQSTLSQQLAVSIVDDRSLFDEIGRSPATPQAARPGARFFVAAIVAATLLVAGVAAFRRRSSIA